MSLVNFFEFFKSMWLVGVSEKATVRTDRYLACLAEVTQSRVMLRTQFLLPLSNVAFLLLHNLHNISEEPARNQLVSSESSAAMWALWTCLLNPLFQTGATRQFRAVRAHDSVCNSAEADKAAEKLVKLDIARSLSRCPRTHYIRVDRLNAWSAIVTPGWCKWWDVVVVGGIVSSICAPYCLSMISRTLLGRLLVLFNLL